MNFYLIYAIIVTFVLIYLICQIQKLQNKENRETFAEDIVANFASVYNNGNLVVDNLIVKNQANIGNWRIKNDVIGIKDRGDMHFATDKWIRLLEYDKFDTNLYTGTYNGGGGFASANLWCGNGSLYGGNVIAGGNLTVANQANIANWRIKSDRIGIPGRSDLHLSSDFWCKLLKYDEGDYVGGGGFASANLWCHNGSLYAGNITTAGDMTVNNKLTVKNGSDFSGGRHYFSDEEKKPKLRVGAAWGIPGIYAESGGKLVLQNFELGTAQASTTNTGGMRDDRKYGYIKSYNDSYALLNKNGTGNFGISQGDRMWFTFLEKGERTWNYDYGNNFSS